MEITERQLLEAITFGIGELLLIPNQVRVADDGPSREFRMFGYIPHQAVEFRVHVYLEEMEFSIGVQRGGRRESMDFDIADPESFEKAAQAILEWDVVEYHG